MFCLLCVEANWAGVVAPVAGPSEFRFTGYNPPNANCGGAARSGTRQPMLAEAPAPRTVAASRRRAQCTAAQVGLIVMRSKQDGTNA